MEITGTIKKIFALQSFPSGFKKREIILYTNEQYPQNICIEFIQEKINLLDNFKVENEVKISISLKGREWTNPEGVTKYFNTIQAWRIENLHSSKSLNNNFYKNNNINSTKNIEDDQIEDTFDDLPF